MAAYLDKVCVDACWEDRMPLKHGAHTMEIHLAVLHPTQLAQAEALDCSRPLGSTR